MTITGTEAYEAMRAHHQVLGEQLSARVSAVSAAAAAGRPHEAAVAGLIAYLAGEILPHAAAEETTIYPAAAALDGLAGTVSEMTAEHTILSEAAGRLAEAADAADAARRAEEIARLFAGHVVKENDILLPALLASDVADLPELLAGMHRRTRQAAQASPAEAAPAADPQATVLSLLLQAATALARTGQADRACRLAAAAWAALREPRPDLAVTVTAALHGLARHAGGAPVQAGPAGGNPAVRTPASDPDLDVRDLLPPGGTRRSSRPTTPSLPAPASSWSTTTTPSRCATSSKPSTPASSPGTTGKPGRRRGGCGSGGRSRPRLPGRRDWRCRIGRQGRRRPGARPGRTAAAARAAS